MFDSLDEEAIYPAVVMVYGGPGEGKTHWAFHRMPGPVYCANTEGGRLRFVAQKAKRAGKALHIKSCVCLKDVKDTVRAAIKASDPKNPGTFVFDSASDLLTLAQKEYMKETRSDKIYPQVVWGRVYEKITAMHEALTRRGFNVVYLCRDKAEYVGETKTGGRMHDGFKRLPFMADVILYAKDGKFFIESNKLLRPGLRWKDVDIDLSWADLFLQLSDPASILLKSPEGK